MDLNQLREAFNLSASLIERIKAFHHNRIEAILNKDEDALPIPLIDIDGPTFILHAIPIGFSDLGQTIDLKNVTSTPQTKLMENLWNWRRFNSDGYVLLKPHDGKSNEWDAYFQVFRDGTIECVRTLRAIDIGSAKAISLTRIEAECIDLLETSLRIQRHLQVEPPLVIFFGLINVKGHILNPSGNSLAIVQRPCEKTKVLPSDVIIENYEQDWLKAIRPIFDVFWNAGGFVHSSSYDADGKWIR